MRPFRYLAIFAAACLAHTASAQIQQGTAGVELQLVATVGSGANAPSFGVPTSDPRFLYVGQQTGTIRILDFNQSTPLLGTTFLNVGAVLGSSFTSIDSGERGLLGGAFHPNFFSSDPMTPGYHKFYTYTSETIASGSPNFFHESETGFTYDHQSVIREWTANAPDAQGVITINTSIPSRVLMRIAEPEANHNGGALAFGPDNYLYISLGDGGGGNDNNGGVNSTTDGHTNQNNPDGAGGIGFLGHGNGQDRRNVYGKILRIKPTTDAETPTPVTTLSADGQYRIPNDNPFTPQSNPMGNQIPGWQASWVDEIYAFGLRNPFRIGFDRNTGKLYAGDVGQDTREEVDSIVKGGNYGWVAREGRIQNPSYPLASNPGYVAATGASFIDPLADYPNEPTGDGGTAVIGGYVYRGGRDPALDGKYVFGDLTHSSTGGRMMYMDINSPGPNQIYDLAITGSFAKPTAALHGIAEDASGELYYLFDNGQIVKLLPTLIPGDYNRDGRVDQADYVMWRKTDGTPAGYNAWRTNFGTTVLGASGAGDVSIATPELSSVILVGQAMILIGMAGAPLFVRRRSVIYATNRNRR